MSEGGYKIRNQHAVHFITFAVSEVGRRIYQESLPRYYIRQHPVLPKRKRSITT